MPVTKDPSQLLLGLALLFSVGTASAQQAPDRGRLPDGRAYRIEKGMRLSDYIAELEVANDDLRRQLIAAEDELIDFQKERARGGKGPELKESDLVPRKSAAPVPAANPPPVSTALLDACNTERSELVRKVAALGEQLAQPKPEQRCNYDSPENPYLERTQTLQKTLADSSSTTARDLLAEKDRRESVEQELARLKEDCADQRSKTADLEEKLQQATSSLASVRTETDRARAALSSTPPAEAVTTEAPAVEEKAAVEPVPAGDLTALKANLKEIQALIIERKNLLDSVKSHGKGISISLQPLVAKNGKSLDTLRAEIGSATASTDVSELSESLAEITKLLNDDLNVLRRLTT